VRIAAVCPTYKRPHLLGRAIHCFLQQTHPDRELVILDDAGQYPTQSGDRWRLVGSLAAPAGVDAGPRFCVECLVSAVAM